MNYKRTSRFLTLLFFLLSVTLTAKAQNVIVNGDFEGYNIYGAITAPSSTDYTRVNGQYIVEAGRYVINTTTTGHGGGQGWPNPGGSHGKYMIVNGFGGNTNPTKVVWKQTVSVSTQTTYTLTYRVVNLNQVYYGQIYPAKIQVKINGQNQGAAYQLPSNNNWQNQTLTWNSGSNTSAIIEFYDVCTNNSGMGDDFCLDDISFVPDVTYSVDANDDTGISACMNVNQDISVLANDVILPNSNGAVVSVVIAPSYGTVSLINNNTVVRYTYTGGSTSGTDQFKYRVTTHGVYDEAWVHINVGQIPVVSNISAGGPICAGGALNISTPSVNPNITGQWVYSASQSGTFQPFDPTNIPLSMNGKYVRYSATNDCGEGHSNAVQITVTEGPSFSQQTPQIPAICAGGNLNLTPPTYSANGSQILSYGWVASQTENGNYTTFNNNSLNNIPASYNGWYIRYMIEGSCGFVYSNPARLLTVNVAPDVTGTLQAPPAICAGGDLNVTAPTYDGNGTGSWEIAQNQNGTYQPFSILNVPVTYNNWYLHYKVSNDCGSDVSNAVQIHVYDAPTIATPATPSAICAGSSFNLTTPTIQNNGSTITDQGWQIAATQNGTYSQFSNNNVPYTYNQYWIRYFAENECGETHSASVQITVNDEPLVGAITAPAGICAGQSFNLTAPQVTWRHTNQGTGSWEIQINGVWQTLTNSNIPYAYNGCSIRYKAVNGCGTGYSTNNVQVTVYSTDPIEEGEITACDAIYHHGVYCYQSGTYVGDTTINGCVIQVSWQFTLSEAYTETQTFTACESFTWPKNGQTYYTTCTDTYIYESSDPLICDSIFTLVLTVNHAPTISGNLQSPPDACSGSALMVTAPAYQMNHTEGGTQRWEYATSQNGPFHPFDPSTYHLDYGSYFLRFVVVNECDSAFSNTVPFNVDDTPVISGQLSAFQVCENNPLDLPEVDVDWRNTNVNDRVSEWQMANAQNGTYTAINPNMLMQMSHNGCWIRFYAHNSCGNDILGPVPITVLSAENQLLDTITACDAYQLPSGEVITETQVVEYEVFEPCFHILYQPVVINHSDYVVEPITSCHETYEWHGRVFHRMEQTQYAWDTLLNANGCDSIVELNLSFDEYSSYTHNRTACGSYVWEMNPGHVYYETQRDSVFVPGVNPEDCDTWYYLELTLGHDTLVDGGGMIECSGFEWHGVPYYADAVLYDSLQTAVTHCDSIIFYNLTIIPLLSGEESIVSCQSIWWQEHYCEEAGDYQHTFTSMQGCDSIVTLHFSLAEEIETEVDTTACEFFNWQGFYFSESGQTFSYTFQTPAGCDSTVTMHANIITTQVFTQLIPICDSTEYGGVLYTEPGSYYIYGDTIFSQSGCDSIIYRINLTVKDSENIGTISGNSSVYVASSLVSGVYRYEIDMEGLVGPVTWSLSNSDWQIVETGIDFCRVLVTTPVMAYLTAHFSVEECGEMDRSFAINASFFGVDDMEDLIHVFPNPTRGTVTVEAEGMESIRLTNMMGQVLELREGNLSDSVVLNLSGYAPSVYLIEIETAYGTVKKRLVLCR